MTLARFWRRRKPTRSCSADLRHTSSARSTAATECAVQLQGLFLSCGSGLVVTGGLLSTGGLAAAVVVLEPDDVILAEVVAVLDFDEHQWPGAGVVYPVRDA